MSQNRFWKDFFDFAVRETRDSGGGATADREGLEQLAALERRYRWLLEQIPAAVYIADLDRTMTLRYVSPRIEVLLGFPRERWLTEPGFWLERVHPDDREQVVQLAQQARAAREPVACEYRMTASDGAEVSVRDERTLVELNGGPRFWQGVLVEAPDPGENGAAPAAEISIRDELTGLPTRTLLREHLRLALARVAGDEDREAALLYLGLDDFKLVNDSFGHAGGDEVLRQVAGRLLEVTRPTNLVVRPSGDEFAVMLCDLDDDAQHVAEIVAGQITDAMERPFSIDGREFQISASIGVSIFPRDAHDEEELLKHGEAAMYEAKSGGRGSLAVYAGGTMEALDRLMMNMRLRKALEREEFVLHYQPIFSLPDGKVMGAEALIRWRDPERGLIAPLEFIPAAEYTGLIEPIGEWVIEAICAQSRSWHDEGLDVPISFNVSLRQFQGAGFAANLRERMGAAGLDPSCFIVEITESTAMREPSCVEPVLQELHDSGLQIAIDDFGTGYSSFSRLQHMPVQMIKIDSTFLRGAPDDAEAARITGAAIDLVRALGMEAVAEGVETEEQRRFLIERGCPLAQGFHLAHPAPAADITPLLRGMRTPA